MSTYEKEKGKKKKNKKCQGKEEKKEDNSSNSNAALKSALTEIDDLFAGAKQAKKRGKEESMGETTEEVLVNNKPKKKTKKEVVKEHEIEHDLPHGLIKSNVARTIINPEAPVERIDKESGYKVYKAHLLKVGEGGGTPLCPFDCDCCF